MDQYSSNVVASAPLNSQPNDLGGDKSFIKSQYIKAVSMVELLHRRLLDVIKDELERIDRTDINTVQALLLYNIGDSELTAGELRHRGYYLGSNVSYNLKKLVDLGFVHHERSRSDRRSVRIKLTDMGRDICAIVDRVYAKHIQTLDKVGGLNLDDLNGLNTSLLRLERFWSDQIRYQL